MNTSMHISENTTVKPTLIDSQYTASIRFRALLTITNKFETRDWSYAREEIALWFDDETALDTLIAELNELKDMRRKELNREQEHVDAIESTASVC